MADEVMTPDELQAWIRNSAPAFQTPTPGFSKPAIVERHESARGAVAALPQGVYTSTMNFSRRGEPASIGEPASLAKYKSILLGELILDHVHKGRVLYGTLVVTPFRMTSLMTVVEDSAGFATIITVPPTSVSVSDFPINSKVAILEPYFKLAMDGSFCIRVDDASRIVRIDDISEVVAIRLEGNARFASQKWKEAVEAYTKCVAACSKLLAAAQGGGNGPSKDKVETVLLPALANRSEAYMRLEEFTNAVVDCNAALAIDKDHVKSLFRKGRAFMGMGKMELACKWLEKAFEKDSSLEIAGFLDKARAAAADDS